MELTWVGHATALIDLDGYRILTDPLLTHRVAHLRRRRAVPDADQHDIDLILLSHVDGLYTADPRLDPNARLIHEVTAVDESIWDVAGDTLASVMNGTVRLELNGDALQLTPADAEDGAQATRSPG